MALAFFMAPPDARTIQRNNKCRPGKSHISATVVAPRGAGRLIAAVNL
jgi:hypothetical protein